MLKFTQVAWTLIEFGLYVKPLSTNIGLPHRYMKSWQFREVFQQIHVISVETWSQKIFYACSTHRKLLLNVLAKIFMVIFTGGSHQLIFGQPPVTPLCLSLLLDLFQT